MNIPFWDSNEKLDHSCKCTLLIMIYYRKRSGMFDFFFTGISHTNSYDDNLIMWNIGDYSGSCWQKAFHKHKDPIFNFLNKSSALVPETSQHKDASYYLYVISLLAWIPMSCLFFSEHLVQYKCFDQYLWSDFASKFHPLNLCGRFDQP